MSQLTFTLIVLGLLLLVIPWYVIVGAVVFYKLTKMFL